MGLFRRKPDFAAEVRRTIDETVAPGTVVTQIDDDTIQIDSLIIGLANLRAKWNHLDVDERRPWLKEALPALVSPPAIPSRLETTEPLRPGIRPRSMLESARLTNLNNEVNPGANRNRPLIPFQHFGGDLVTVLLWDAPTTMSVVNQSQLEEWGARFQDLLPVAIDNLEDAPNAGWTATNKRVWTSRNEDDYDGARMLLPSYLEQTGLAGELVVIHPNRNLLVVTAVDDADGIRIACELALEDLHAPSPISFQPLVGRDEDWRPLGLPPSHPAYRQWQQLRCLSHEMNYTSLREPIQQLVGEDLFVSGFQVAEAADGSFVSLTTWTEGVPSLLPKSDLIGLVTERGEAITADWDSVQRMVATTMEPTDHFPELWRVMSFPNASDLAKLRTLSSR
ncbi:MAG: hypothetical protein ACRBK7_00225 [Acidimicrobiales bacterium]